MHQVHQYMAIIKQYRLVLRIELISQFHFMPLQREVMKLIAYSYSHLFNLNTTGLRFFTVYGPWGRPDMAMYIFANNYI